MEIEKKSKINNKTKLIMGSVGALALFAVSAGGAMAYSQSKSETSDKFLNRVAEIVGVEPAVLKSGFNEAAIERIDQRVTDENLTEEQANRMKEKLEAGNVILRGPGIGKNMPFRGVLSVEIEELAAYLNLTRDELKAKHDEGKTLLEIANEQGKSEEELRSYLTSRFDENLELAVSEGGLTQEEAEKISETQDELIDKMINEDHTKSLGKNIKRLLKD